MPIQQLKSFLFLVLLWRCLGWGKVLFLVLLCQVISLALLTDEETESQTTHNHTASVMETGCKVRSDSGAWLGPQCCVASAAAILEPGMTHSRCRRKTSERLRLERSACGSRTTNVDVQETQLCPSSIPPYV